MKKSIVVIIIITKDSRTIYKVDTSCTGGNCNPSSGGTTNKFAPRMDLVK